MMGRQRDGPEHTRLSPAGRLSGASADIPAIEELLLRISRLVEEVPEISELDLNPVMALPPGQGCLIVDARISVEG